MRFPLLFALTFAASAALADKTEPKVTPPGDKPSPKTHVLKSGAPVLQTDAPVTGMDVYLVGFHAMKDLARVTDNGGAQAVQGKDGQAAAGSSSDDSKTTQQPGK